MRASVASLSRKFISVFFTATLALGLVPAAAFAEPAPVAPATESSESANADSDIQAEAEASAYENSAEGMAIDDGSFNGDVLTDASEAGSPTNVISSEGDEASNPHVISTEPSDSEASGEISSPNDGKDASSAALPAGEMINQEMPLDTIAQAESTRSFFLAQTLESTKTVPMISAKLPIDTGANDAADVATTEDGAPSSEGEGGDGSEGDPGSDDPVDPSFTLGSSEGDSAAVAEESTVIGSFIYLGMTFAIEPGGESVALMAVDYPKLPEEYIQKQVLVIPDTATPDGIDYYSVTRIADDAFAGLTKESANPDYVGCEALFTDKELLAKVGISQEEVQQFLSDDGATAAAQEGESANADSDIQAQAEACAYGDQATPSDSKGDEDSPQVISGVVSLSDDSSQHVISSDKDEASPANVISSGVSEANGVEKSRPSDEDGGEASADSGNIRTIVSMEGNVATLDDGSTYTFANPLAGCAGILALGIPSSVTTIGDDAFSGFSTLQYVVVSEDNSSFASYDGALYSADLVQLRLIPEGRVGAVRVASSATGVDSEVFSHCPSVDALVADAEGNGERFAEQAQKISLSLASMFSEYNTMELTEMTQIPYGAHLSDEQTSESAVLEVDERLSQGAGTTTVDPNGGYLVQYYRPEGDSGNLSWYDQLDQPHTTSTWVGFMVTAATDSTGSTNACLYNGGSFLWNGQYQGIYALGWSRSPAGGSLLSPGYVLTATEGTLYTIFPSHTVSFDKQGGTGGISSVTATVAKDMPVITTPTRTGYTFGGYYSGTNGTGTQYYKADGTSARKWDKNTNTTLYAHWLHTVTFDKQGGSGGTDSIGVANGKSIGTITKPSLSGWTFRGYTDDFGANTYLYVKANGTGTTRTITGTRTLKANWTRSVSLNANGGTAGSLTSMTAGIGRTLGQKCIQVESTVADYPIRSIFNKGITDSSDWAPTREGYVFAGYYNTSASTGGTCYIDANGIAQSVCDPVTSSMPSTLYARWNPKVTFDKQGGSGGTDSVGVPSGSSIGTITKPSLSGWTFRGYTDDLSSAPYLYVKANGTGTTRTITGTRTLKANWTRSVSLNANGGTAGSLTSITAGIGRTLGSKCTQVESTDADYPIRSIFNKGIKDDPGWAPKRIGYKFAGYYDTSASTGGTCYISAFGSAQSACNPVTSSMPSTLYARWTPNTYTVEYWNKAGTAKLSSATFTYDSSKALAAKPTSGVSTGYNAVGWAGHAGQSIKEFDFEEIVSDNLAESGTVKLYLAETPNTYTVEYWDKVGRNKLSSATFTYDTSKALAAQPTTGVTSGYTAVGWATSTGQSSKTYDFGSSQKNLATSGTVKLYLAETPNTYTVQYLTHDGREEISSDTFTYDTSKALAAQPTTGVTSGYTAVGWATSTGQSSKTYDFGSSQKNLATSGTVKLYLAETPNTYTVQYLTHDGREEISSDTFTYDQSKALAAEPSYGVSTGYRAVGWIDCDDPRVTYDLGQLVKNLVPEGCKQLLLSQTPNKYTILLDGNGENSQVSPSSINATYDAAVTLPTPTRKGYSFAGWNTQQNGHGDAYGAGDQEAINLTPNNGGTARLYAQWTANDYTVTFDPNREGTTVISQEQTYGALLKALPAGTLCSDDGGFRFAGYFDEDGKQYYSSDGTPVAGIAWDKDADTTLYAHWKYRIYFDKNDDEARATLPAGAVQADGTVKVTLTGGTGEQTMLIHDYDTDAPYMWATWHGEAEGAAYAPVYLPGATRANYPGDGSPAQSYGQLQAWRYAMPGGETGRAFANTQLPDQRGIASSLELRDGVRSVTMVADWAYSVASYDVRLVASTAFAGAAGIDAIDNVAIANDAARTQVIKDVTYGSPIAEGEPSQAVPPIAEGSQHLRFAGYYAKQNAGPSDVCYIDAEGVPLRMLDRGPSDAAGTTVDLYARWVVANYDITFDLAGADADQAAKRPDNIEGLTYYDDMPMLTWDGSTDNAGKVPTRAGYEFRGYFDKDGIQYYDAELNRVVQNAKWHSAYDATTLYARWAYQVDLDMNLGEEGSSKALDSVVAKDGTVVKEAGAGSAVHAVSATEYTSSDALDAFSISPDVTKANNIPSELGRLRGEAKAGYRFVGFTAERGNRDTLITESWLANEDNVRSLLPEGGRNAVLYALWEPVAYTVTFQQSFTDSNGDELAPQTPGTPSVYAADEEEPVTYDTPLPASFEGTAPVMEGYTFDGYYTGSGKKYFAAGTDGDVVVALSDGEPVIWDEPLSADGAAEVTLYARYIRTSHVVTFDVCDGYASGYDDGWTPDPKRYFSYVNLNAPLMPPNGDAVFAAPQRYGYTFAGWFSERGGHGTRYSDADGIPTAAVWDKDASGVVYAAWTPKTYEVTWLYNYEGNGADEGAFATTEQTFDLPLVLPEGAPVRPGFSSFDGWYTAATGGSRVNGQMAFSPSGLEDRQGNLLDDGAVAFYARYSGAETYWVKLLAGEGGRFNTDDSSYEPEDRWYAFGSATEKKPVLEAGSESVVELRPAEQHLTPRLEGYSFAGWEEVDQSWLEENSGSDAFDSVAATVPDSVYGEDTTLPNGEVRLAGTLKDDLIPAGVLGNRTFRAVWVSSPVQVTLKLGSVSAPGGAQPSFDADELDACGFSTSGDASASGDWESPFEPIDLSAIATCEGYELVGFVPEGQEEDADAADKAITAIEASKTASPAMLAGAYVAIWRALDYEVVFHVNYGHSGEDSAYDTKVTSAYDALVELPYPNPAFPYEGADEGSYTSYGFKWWGLAKQEYNSEHAAWKADEEVPLCDLAAKADGRTVHLYAQWLPQPINVTIPLYVTLAVDADTEGAEVLVADWDGKDEGNAFVGLQSTTGQPFRVHSITCDVANRFEQGGGTEPLVRHADGSDVGEGELFLTIRSERQGGTELPFDLGKAQSSFRDDKTQLADGTVFDADADGFLADSGDTRVPLKFGLSFGDGKKMTDFRFADGLVVDDVSSHGELARIIYTIEALV